RVLYREDVYVGYRYHENIQIKPLFPFGHGLSYTKFCLSNLGISLVLDDRGNTGAERIIISFMIENVGPRLGTETILACVSSMQAAKVTRPAR
ncbi:hypothetical protein GQ53DRAFT_672677, partial [Thozetella sp. PMI_491]